MGQVMGQGQEAVSAVLSLLLSNPEVRFIVDHLDPVILELAELSDDVVTRIVQFLLVLN